MKRNGRPHLSGPSGRLEGDEAGRKVLNPDGQLLERDVGDPEWAYVQWDSNLEPVRADIDLHTEASFTMKGLSRFMFQSDGRQNIYRSSATSLRRLMVAFAARVAKIRDVSEDGYLRLIDILNRSRGSDVFAIDNRNVSFYFPYEELFASDDPQDNDDGSDLSAGSGRNAGGIQNADEAN